MENYNTKLNVVHYIGRQRCKRKMRVSHTEKSDPKSFIFRDVEQKSQRQELMSKLGCRSGDRKSVGV